MHCGVCRFYDYIYMYTPKSLSTAFHHNKISDSMYNNNALSRTL